MTKISVTQQHFDDVQAKFAEAIGAFHENKRKKENYEYVYTRGVKYCSEEV